MRNWLFFKIAGIGLSAFILGFAGICSSEKRQPENDPNNGQPVSAPTAQPGHGGTALPDTASAITTKPVPMGAAPNQAEIDSIRKQQK